MDKVQELELLAPAGSLETLKAVMAAGADAVYVGGSLFGARAYAQNLNREELLEAIDYGHLHGRKVFLTVNTLVKNQELKEQLYEYLLPYYEAGLDAVIVQDFGVMHFIREHFNSLPIHASTQMTIAGADGARLLQELGASRIVTARELSLSELSVIHQEVDAEIESFIHGALCYSYSGQCLFSSILGGRSGNRGRCAQPCRLGYEVYDGNRRLLNPKLPYILSLKDLNTLEFLPEIAESGVYSFKIEGRMKSTRYAAGVVSVYRSYMDRYLSMGKEGYYAAEADERKLFDFGNRNGFTGGYYQQRNGADMLTGGTSTHSKSDAAKTDALTQEYTATDLKEKIHGKLTISQNKPAIMQVWDDTFQIKLAGDAPQPAKKRPIGRDVVLEKLNRTGATPFIFEDLALEMEENIFLPMTSINHMRQEALERLKAKHLEAFRRRAVSDVEAIRETQRDKNANQRQQPKTRDLIVSTEIREGLTAALCRSFVTDIYLDSILYTREKLLPELAEDIRASHQAGKRVFYLMPAVFREDTRHFYTKIIKELLALKPDGFVVRSYDELGFLKRYVGADFEIRLDAGLYTYSDEAKDAFAEDTGCLRDTIPVELNRGELLHRRNDSSDFIVYGRLPLMVSAGCVVKNTLGCQKQRNILYLKDRYGIEFPVRNICSDCYNIIYNARPLFLLQFSGDLGMLDPAGCRIHFTLETREEIDAVLDFASDTLVAGRQRRPEECLSDYTNGHYKRGVE